MRSVFAMITVLAVGFALSGCSNESGQDPQYSRVCIDQNTRERVDGSQCGSDDSSAASGFLWWYLIWGRTLPSYGSPVSGGYRTVPSSSVIEHDERLAPQGGTSYKKATTRGYSTGSGKKLGTTKGGTGYKAPAPKAPAPAPKPANPAPKAPAPKAPAPVIKAPAPRPVAPAPRPAAPRR
jgi:hypothetical protein